MRDPDKVRRLKLGLPQWGGGDSRVGQEDDVGQQQSNGRNGGGSNLNNQQQREDWSPINKRRRRLSGSDLDINPAAPAPRGGQHGAQGQQDEQQWGDGEWEGVGEQHAQEREPQWPRGPSWEDQLQSTWSGRRGAGGPGSQQGRPYQHGWPGARSNM